MNMDRLKEDLKETRIHCSRLIRQRDDARRNADKLRDELQQKDGKMKNLVTNLQKEGKKLRGLIITLKRSQSALKAERFELALKCNEVHRQMCNH